MRLSYLALSFVLVAGTAHAEPACRKAIGAQKAAALVRQCIAVSEATHPPCNAENPCALIVDEIKSWCQGVRGVPPKRQAFCAQYR